MKKLVNDILYGKNSMINGLIALSVIGFIGFGCFCNKDKMNFGKNDSSSPSPTTSASPSPSATKEFKKADASKYELPSEDEQQEIVKTTLLDFNDALQDEDFTDFYDKISKYWQKQTSPEKMKKSFQGFIDGEADLSPIRSMKANITNTPKVEKSGSLRKLEIKGEYNTTPNKTTFELQYIPEGKDWKLFGINVITNVKRRS